MEFPLTCDQFAPREARAILRARIEGVSEAVGAILELLVTELVNNAVVHGEGPVRMSIVQREGCVRIAVSDASSEGPILRPLDPDLRSGRGLFLIDALASAWGVERAKGGGKAVWFELDPTRTPTG